MRIVIHDYAGHPFQVDLSRELAKRGHVVVHAFAGGLLTPRGALNRREDDAPGLSFREVPMHADYRKNKYSFLRRRNYEATYGRSLVKVIKEIRPDILLSGNTPTEPQRRVQRYCKRNGIRFVNWVQDIYGVAVNKLMRKKLPFVGPLIGHYYLSADKRCLHESDHNIVITPDFEHFLLGWGVMPSRITVVPNWAALGSIPVQPKHNPWAERHDLADKFVFLYSGTLAMKHNPDLIRSLAQAFADTPGIVVVVISEGPGAEWLEQAKTEHGLCNLKLLPFQPFEELPLVLGTADILLAVLESDAGTFSVPSKVLSYLCAGRPLLTAMPPENLAAKLVQTIPAGISVPPDDTSAFVDQARRLYADAASRQQYSVSARRYAESNFQVESVTDRFERLFTTLWNSP